MPRRLYNLARVLSATAGTGTITLGAAVSGFLTFAGAGVQDGEVVYYGIRDSGHSEVGYGTYTASGTTLTRTVLKSTNSDAAIDLSGSAEVFITGPAQAWSVGRQTIWVPASAMIAAITSGPASASLESATNDVNYRVFDFDASADEHAHFNVAFPKGWDLGAVRFQVYWSTTATDTDGVAWGLQGIAIPDGDPVDTAWGTAVVVTDDAQSAAGDVLITAESGDVTIGGTPAADDLTFFRVFRDVSDGNDDMTEDARLIGVKIFYNIQAGNDD
jgi:hypothetical protein